MRTFEFIFSTFWLLRPEGEAEGDHARAGGVRSGGVEIRGLTEGLAQRVVEIAVDDGERVPARDALAAQRRCVDAHDVVARGWRGRRGHGEHDVLLPTPIDDAPG